MFFIITQLVFNSFNTNCKKFYKKELDTAQAANLGISTFGSPTSFKASFYNFVLML
ncbi:hypothetical protein HMPREF9554_01246 [Treponema phagedenis F0421]|nr:hypothetical protein HMPREF9554_01246 [Treponema phagedenis F0421]